MAELTVVSIGALAANPLWGERAPVRTGHTTTALIRARDRLILVDPGLPAQALVPRLAERVNLAPDAITDVFLTSFAPEARRALSAFPDARWWIGPEERETVGVAMAQTLKDLLARPDRPGDDTLREALEQDVALLRRCKPAPESIADRVDLFPMPGLTPGLCGLVLEGPRFTTVVCGDAIPTAEHLERGSVLPGAADLERARQSFEEALELADLLLLGRDNIVVNPTKRPF